MSEQDYVFVCKSGEDLDTIKESPGMKMMKGWLAPPDVDSEYQKQLDLHAHGTGEWILNTDAYRQWNESKTGDNLWIGGSPGSGKSVLTAHLLSQLQKKGCPVLFFFCRYDTPELRSPGSVVRAFLYNLLEHSPLLKQSLKVLEHDYPNVDTVPVEQFWKCLSAALRLLEGVYCVVDAVDEMEVDQEFLQRLLDLGHHHGSVKIILTSRHLSRFEKPLEGCYTVDLNVNQENVDKDIATYVASRLKSCQHIHPDQADNFKKAIIEKANGLFLYARLLLDHIWQSEVLPDNLQDLGCLYTSVLRHAATRSQTSESFQEFVLGCIIHSARPLQMKEITAMVNSLPDRAGLGQSQDVPTAIREACGPLLELCGDGVVRIVHQSVTEFLIDSESGIPDDDRFPVIDSQTIHGVMTHVCIDYLNNGCLSDWPTGSKARALGYRSKIYAEKQQQQMQLFPLLQYAVQFWPFHVARAHSSPELLRRVYAFLVPNNSHVKPWKSFYRGVEPKIPGGFTPLHVAAHCGVVGFIEYLLRAGVDPDQVDGLRRTALVYAAMQGHSRIIMLFQQFHADLNKTDYVGLAPVHYAVRHNRPGALRTLLAGGAHPMMQKMNNEVASITTSVIARRGDTPLLYACRSGFVKCLLVLQDYLTPEILTHGPLHWAAERGHANIVQVLLQHQAVREKIDEKGAEAKTALYLAARFRDNATVRTLLDHGANVRALSGERGGPYHYPLDGWANLNGSSWEFPLSPNFCMQEMKDILHALLDAGCDINSRDRYGRTVLYQWREYDPRSHGENGDQFVSMLLRHGADATGIDHQGRTPLHGRGGFDHLNEKAIRMLVDAGADINAVDVEQRTFLIEAALHNAVDDPTVFHDLQADFNIQDRSGNTALHYLVKNASKCQNLHKWLPLTDLTLENKKGETILTCLLNSGIPIQTLKDWGLSIESRNSLGQTALLDRLAQSEIGKSMLRELLDHGADVNARDNQGKSALHYLASFQMTDSNSVDIMQMLIDAGADVHAVDNAGNSIMQDAIGSKEHWHRTEKLTKALVKSGAPLGLHDHQGRSILHVAAVREDLTEFWEETDPKHTRLYFLLQPQFHIPISADNDGITPLHLAAAVSGVNTWKLLEAGADVKAVANDGRTALHYAAAAGNCNVVGILLQRDKHAVTHQDDEGQTALHEAARSGRHESVKFLLDAGADPCIQDNQGRTPLQAAAEFQPPAYPMGRLKLCENYTKRIEEVIRLLLQAGADPEQVDHDQLTASDVSYISASSVQEPQKKARSTYLPNRAADYLSLCIEDNMEAWAGYLECSMNRKEFLEHALSAGHDGILERLFQKGLLKQVEWDGPSLLVYAARWGLIDLMRRLIPHVQDFGAFKLPLLDTATERDLYNVDMMKLLIEAEIKAHPSDHGTQWPQVLHSLARGERWWHVEAAAVMLEAGANPNDTSKELMGWGCYRPLHDAVSGPGLWHEQIFDLFLQYGADVNPVTHHGSTLLNIAMEKGKMTIFQKLLDHGADWSAGQPMICSAVESGNLASVEMVLKAGVNPNAEYRRLGYCVDDEDRVITPLFRAACASDRQPDLGGYNVRNDVDQIESMMRLLLRYGADPFYSVKDGSTVLHEICSVNGLVKPILEAGVDINLRDSQGRTPLIRACEFPNDGWEYINGEYTPIQLMELGADVNATDESGMTALHYAIKARLPKTIEELLKRSASINTKDLHGHSPLSYALQKPHPCGVDLNDVGWATEILLDAGADPLKKMPGGQTALHRLAPCVILYVSGSRLQTENEDDPFPSKIRHKDLYQRLVDAGCGREARDDDGNTPIFAYVSAPRKTESRNFNPPGEQDHRAMFEEHDIHAVNHAGDTLLHVIARRNSEDGAVDLFKMLMDMGLSLDKTNNEGLTALDVAKAAGRDDILAVFGEVTDAVHSSVGTGI